jgi:hypothetical protein
VALPEVIDEVRTAFEAYQAALLANDVPALDGWFLDDPSTSRFGIGDVQHGHDELVAWRATARPVSPARELLRTDVVVLGNDAAVITCEFRDEPGGPVGRQSQTWARLAEGWRIVHAHVSLPQS